jgi:hypothetical protein
MPCLTTQEFEPNTFWLQIYTISPTLAHTVYSESFNILNASGFN